MTFAICVHTHIIKKKAGDNHRSELIYKFLLQPRKAPELESQGVSGGSNYSQEDTFS